MGQTSSRPGSSGSHKSHHKSKSKKHGSSSHGGLSRSPSLSSLPTTRPTTNTRLTRTTSSPSLPAAAAAAATASSSSSGGRPLAHSRSERGMSSAAPAPRSGARPPSGGPPLPVRPGAPSGSGPLTSASGNRVLKENELIGHLEQMGFPREVIVETLRTLHQNNKGKRTVVDPNRLIEQLIAGTQKRMRERQADQPIAPLESTLFSMNSSSSRTSDPSSSSSSSTTSNSTSSVSSDPSSTSSSSSTSLSSPYINPFLHASALTDDLTYSNPFATDSQTTHATAPLSPSINPFLMSKLVNNVEVQERPETDADVASSSSGSDLSKSSALSSSVGGDDRETEVEWGKCKICWDAPIETVILRCGHLAMCTECSKLKMKACPICRKPIHEIVRIYTA
eukprot:TRINITY_DN1573_c0_g1_i5.p1 TRINITY_DN1573_c0_g1~~TRINITY_DN1573_c0_g1_i5.p1  ORF type:complete len:394 (+),score=98.66 TRINITY_DN1573_c0_g1_i5:109-1290(+)